jgi:hypothetical protein
MLSVDRRLGPIEFLDITACRMPTLDQHIGVRIPGGQPNQINNLRSCGFPGVP